MTQDFNFSSRSNGGPKFYEPNWSQFMNKWNVGGRDASGTPGPNRTYSWTITFNNYGRQRFYANCDDNGGIYINGNYEMGMGGFGNPNSSPDIGSLVTTTNYYGPGTYTLSANANNSGGGPWGIAIKWQGFLPPPLVYGCTDSRASNYNPNADVNNGTCVYPTPSNTLTITPNVIIAGANATLAWSVSGSTSQTLTGSGSVASSGSLTKSPTNSTTYTLVSSYYGITSRTTDVTITVYQPVVAQFTGVSSNPIIVGQSTTLTWVVSGSANTPATINQGIGAVLFSSNKSVSPSSTTTYTLSASGPGGSDSDSVTIVVNQLPQISYNVPTNIDYGASVGFVVTYRYATGGVNGTAVYSVRNPTTGSFITVSQNISLPGTTSDQSGSAITGTVNLSIPWTVQGVFGIEISLAASGGGGTTNVSNSIDVSIDELPDSITIDPSLNQVPTDNVLAPDQESVLSDPIIVDDIDVAVEIRSNKPIKVKFDDADPLIEANWNDVRQSP